MEISLAFALALFAGIAVGETAVRIDRAFGRRRATRTASRRLRYLQGVARRDRLPGVVIFGAPVARGRIPWTISHGASWSFLSVAPFKIAAPPSAGELRYRRTFANLATAFSPARRWRVDSRSPGTVTWVVS